MQEVPSFNLNEVFLNCWCLPHISITLSNNGHLTVEAFPSSYSLKSFIQTYKC